MSPSYNELESEYCPPIDTALFAAIVPDYNLADPKSFAILKALLDELRTSANEVAQQEETLATAASSTTTARATEEVESSIQASTEISSLSDDMGSLRIETKAPIDETEFDDVPQETKEEILLETFPTLSAYTEHTLPEKGGDAGAVSFKSVDAFAEPRFQKKTRGRKKQRKTQLSSQYDGSSLETSPVRNASPTNSWTSANDDIDFITKKTSMSRPTVTSTYHQHGGSFPKILPDLVKIASQNGATPSLQNQAVKSHVDQLAVDFPRLLLHHRQAIVQLTYPSSSAAHELAQRMVSKSPRGSLEILPSYTPPNLSREPSPDYRRAATSKPAPSAIPQTAASHGMAKTTAMSQASAAYRASKSDKLMRGVAAYYSEVARNSSAAQARCRATEAAALVDAQSQRGSYIDLHKVDRANAEKLTREWVKDWWAGEKENRAQQMGYYHHGARRRADDGFEVITGIGKHSAAGKGTLGPAVRKMLINEGWKIDERPGRILVIGR